MGSDLIRGVAFGENVLIRGVAFGESVLIRGVAFGEWPDKRVDFGESGLIRGVAFGERDLIRRGLLYFYRLIRFTDCCVLFTG